MRNDYRTPVRQCGAVLIVSLVFLLVVTLIAVGSMRDTILEIRSGTGVCILAVGKMLEHARGAADLLAAEGVEATVWDVRSVAPLDAEMLDDAATHPVVVTVEDD